MDDLEAQAQLGDEVEGLGAAGQHRLRAHVEGDAGDRLAAQLPARAVGRVEQGDGRVGKRMRQLPSAGKPSNASPDDDDS